MDNLIFFLNLIELLQITMMLQNFNFIVFGYIWIY